VFSRLYSSELVEEFQNPIWAEWFDRLTTIASERKIKTNQNIE